jgi:hypothetical protein
MNSLTWMTSPRTFKSRQVVPVIQKTAGGRFRSKKFDDSTSGAFLTRVKATASAPRTCSALGAPVFIGS